MKPLFVIALLALPFVAHAKGTPAKSAPAKATPVICTFHPGNHVVCKDRSEYRAPAARNGFNERVYSNGNGGYSSPSHDGFGHRVWRDMEVDAFSCAENGKKAFACSNRDRYTINCERDENMELQCAIPQSELDADDRVPVSGT